MRLLAPHAQRAVTIANLLDTRGVLIEGLSDTLDRLSLGVGILGAGGRILHTNTAARAMLAQGWPIRSEGGRLAASQPQETAALRATIHLAGCNEAQLGAGGLGLPLRGAQGATALAHVLPLARRDHHRRMVQDATAAVFVTTQDEARATGLDVFVRAFGLSPAEGRVLARLMAGQSPAEAAAALGTRLTTAKTHLARILGKTGTSRQSDLRALVVRLCPPVRR